MYLPTRHARNRSYEKDVAFLLVSTQDALVACQPFQGWSRHLTGPGVNSEMPCSGSGAQGPSRCPGVPTCWRIAVLLEVQIEQPPGQSADSCIGLG